jgi:Tfp pilus assembly protein PilV
MQRRLKTRSGATLVEMLVALGILTLIGGVLLALINGSLSGWSSGASAAYADSSASIAVQKLATEVRDGASAAATTGVLTMTYPATLSDPGTGETLYSPGGTGQTRSYLLSSGNLIRRVGGVDTILVRNISTLDFTGTTVGAVRVSITASEQVGKITTQRTNTARIGLRNYQST